MKGKGYTRMDLTIVSLQLLSEYAISVTEGVPEFEKLCEGLEIFVTDGLPSPKSHFQLVMEP